MHPVKNGGITQALYVYKSKRGEQVKRDGWPVNQKRNYLLYKEMDLQLRN
jgi:hypothetical protein